MPRARHNADRALTRPAAALSLQPMASSPAVSAVSDWTARLRLLLAASLVWAGLHFTVGATFFRGGPDRPIVLAAVSPLGGISVALAFTVAAALAAVVAGGPDARRALFALGLGAAAWVFERGGTGGTMDKWLVLVHERPGPANAAPYWPLLLDYLYLAIGLTGAYVAASFVAARLADGQPATGTAGPRAAVQDRQSAAASLATVLIVSGLVIVLATGPATFVTLRGQVYFAVAVGFILGVYVAGKLSPVRPLAWLWPTPIVLGVIGVLVAIWSPALMLPEPYRQQDVIPAWGLVRPLPIEMVSVGIAALCASLKPKHAGRH